MEVIKRCPLRRPILWLHETGVPVGTGQPELRGNWDSSEASSIDTYIARRAALSMVAASRMSTTCLLYAEAFERDADPEDFSLNAIIAHERGHQILARHPRIAKRVIGISERSEEILASLLGALICESEEDRGALFAKAMAELLEHGQGVEAAGRQLQELWSLLEGLL